LIKTTTAPTRQKYIAAMTKAGNAAAHRSAFSRQKPTIFLLYNIVFSASDVKVKSVELAGLPAPYKEKKATVTRKVNPRCPLKTRSGNPEKG
jgi:hypothetical protein